MPNLVTLGCDVGSRYVGWAVLDAGLLAHGVWDLRHAPAGWTAEGYLRQAAAALLPRYDVALLAVERFHWHKDRPVVPAAPAIQGHLGALASLGTHGLAVVRYTAAEWQQGVMGDLPAAHLWGSYAWKRQIRAHLGLVLRYPWPQVRPSDPAAYHDSDAAGLAYHARNAALMAARIRASERR